MTSLFVLSHVQVARLLAARQALARQALARVVVTSLDLNLTEAEVIVDQGGVLLPDSQRLSWAHLERIADNENACYLVEESEIHRIQFFSDYLSRAYSLFPTQAAPTMLVSGFPMHRIKGIDPQQDTLQKIATIRPLTGRVLDTTMGLGYTAIQAARTAEHVTTIELDPTVVEVCRLNPWSQPLFSAGNITRRIGDAFEEIQTFADGAFQRIIHDPPTFSLAGELYSAAFYRELRRVLAPKGRLFHYVGDLESRTGSGVARGVMRRLNDAGFRRVIRKQSAFGVVAFP